MPKLPGSIGKYKITDRLGRGGMSILYKAEHPSLGTPVVLKKLTLKGDPAHRERFRREATLMMKLRHENVVGVYDHFKEGGSHYLVMEFVDGRPLSELMAREGALPCREAAWLSGRIAAALAHIHSEGIVHRDLKPSNVLLGRDGTVKLGDFGIAFTPGGDEDITSEGTALGTPTFMAPEQLEDARKADERSDIWSFGICFFEMLTGRKFVTGPSPAAIREALADAVKSMSYRLPPKLPLGLRRILRKTIRMRPDSRLKDGQAAMRLLGAARQSRKPPEALQARLDSLLASMEPASEPTPVIDDGKKNGSPVNHKSLFKFSLNSSPAAAAVKTVKKSEDGRFKLKITSHPVAASILLLFFLSVAILFAVPGTWNRVFFRNSHGVLRLKLVFPPDAPEHWLTGVEASIYREDGDSLSVVTTPVLRLTADGTSMTSRRVSLPAGAYRLSWSLGDRVSWHSFRLSTFNESKKNGSGMLILEERLGAPPVFSLELAWEAFDAVNGEDLSGKTRLDWERVDKPGGELMSGGLYRIRFDASAYLPFTFTVAVSPWRRNLSLSASLWPEPARITLRNDSERSLVPRLDGSGKYLDMDGSPGMRRIGRIKPGNFRILLLPPGDYELTPGMGNSVVQNLTLDSKDDVTILVESGEDRRLLMSVIP